MLEVTLMNKQAQKRGEWEPVLSSRPEPQSRQ